MIFFTLFVIIVLQIANIVMLQRVFANKNIKELGVLLHEQAERQSTDLKQVVQQGTNAAHAAFEEANTVNKKISDLNERLIKSEQQKR